MAVPDVNCVAAGKECVVTLHFSDLHANFIRRVVVVIVKADNVFAFRQVIEHVAFFTQVQSFRAVNVAHVVHAAIHHHRHQIFVALGGIVQDHQLAFIRRIILILKEIQQIGQKCPAVPRRANHADKWCFSRFFLLLAFEQRLHQVISHLIAAVVPAVVSASTARKRRQ
ncbi:hypothetical protein D3C85_1337830 [compost metagenome]